MISTASDLEWISGTRNFWVLVSHFDDAPHRVLDNLVASLANIIDRMRSGGANYTAALVDSPRTDELLQLLETENDRLLELEKSSKINDTHPITVIDHRGGRPRVVITYHVSSLPEITNAVHVGCSTAMLELARSANENDSGPLYRLDLDDVHTSDDLLRRCAETFEAQAPVSGLASFVPVKTDRYIWEPRRHAVMIVENLDAVPSPVLRQLAWLLTNIVDRMRCQGDRGTVMFARSSQTDELLSLLDAENRALAKVGETTDRDVYPVAVINHRDNEPTA